MARLHALTVLDRTILDRLAANPPTGEDAALPVARDAHWFAQQAFAHNTYKAYRAGIHDFARWTGVSYPFPATPELVAAYLAARADRYAPATLNQRLHAIAFASKALGHSDPTKHPFVAKVMRGIRRTADGADPQQAPSFTLGDFRRLIDAIDDSAAGLRDRAYLLVGLYGAFRQSELTEMTVAHLHETDQGIAVRMGRVKQDQERRHKYVKALPRLAGSPYCPVAALHRWLDVAGITAGPVFRGVHRFGHIAARALSHTATNDLIKKRALKAGLAHPHAYSGHSLRASFVTIMRDMQVPDALIARQTHHRNLEMMTVYDRIEDVFRQSPAVDLGAWLAGDAEAR